MEEKLQFTLGPVQGFVAQARRTRDFWSGSFLLSYLTGKAMLAVIKNQGRIAFPVVQTEEGTIDDPLLQAIATQNGTIFSDNFPMVGSIPNRFMAEIPEGFSGAECVKAVNEAWQAIADEIWNRYVAPVAALGRASEKIWQRQVKSFWEMSWVIGSEPDLLDRRKNWRDHLPPEEPGDKCTLMGNWQELSGYIRRQQRMQQECFWAALAKNLTGIDLHSDERLCAIALIKRIFPRIYKGKVSYPSTSYLSAVPWLTRLLKDEKGQQWARVFMAEARQSIRGNEDPSPFFSRSEIDQELWNFVSLDGTCFFASTLDNDNLWPDDPGVKACRCSLLKKLNEFSSKPSPFYALLLMDGDRLGTLLRDDQENVSRSVRDFSGSVDGLIRECNGLTVYAGGDDVLALLPLQQALPMAARLRERYLEAFSKFNKPRQTTISAAIVYAHHHAPLKQVIGKAHQILERDAKERAGRDALAVAVWKTGGVALEWAGPWELSGDEQQQLVETPSCLLQNGDRDLVLTVDWLLQKLIAGLREKKFTNSWIYSIRKLLRNPHRSEFEIPEGIDLEQMLTAELLQSREIGITTGEAEEVVRGLLTICCHRWRDSEGGVRRDDHRLSLDGALLVKFLATGGVEV